MKNQQGFTLVEMIVSLAIFAIVALVAVGALLKITDANKKSQSLKTAINNLNFALESMSREMRVGRAYHCETGVSSSPNVNLQAFSEQACTTQSADWLIAFRSSQSGGSCDLVHAYWYTLSDSGTFYTIKKAEQQSCAQQTLDATSFRELISPDINLTNSLFKVDIASDRKPKAFFWLKGFAGVREQERTEFELQTSISQRK